MPKENRKPNNRQQIELAPGVMRFSRARMYHKKGLWAKKPFKKVKAPAKKTDDKFVIKKINGSKNGNERKVPKVRAPKALSISRERRTIYKHKRKATPRHKLRKSLRPGQVCILLAGRHKGKRVVFLKHLLKSGLILVTGPMKLNNVPLRRISQAYVIATKTNVDISGVKIPEHINDDYFKREKKPKRQGNKEGDIFAKTTTEYKVSEQRKIDQKDVDTAVLAAIRNDKDKKLLFGYLGSKWSIRKGQAPHKLVF